MLLISLPNLYFQIVKDDKSRFQHLLCYNTMQYNFFTAICLCKNTYYDIDYTCSQRR